MTWRKETASLDVKVHQAWRAVALLARHLGRSRDQLLLEPLELHSPELIDGRDDSTGELSQQQRQPDKDTGGGGIFRMTEHLTSVSAGEFDILRVAPRTTGLASAGDVSAVQEQSAEWIARYQQLRRGTERVYVDFGVGSQVSSGRHAFGALADIVKGAAPPAPPSVRHRLEIAVAQWRAQALVSQALSSTSSGVNHLSGKANVTSSASTKNAEHRTTSRSQSVRTSRGPKHSARQSSQAAVRRPTGTPGAYTSASTVVLPGGGPQTSCAALAEDVEAAELDAELAMELGLSDARGKNSLARQPELHGPRPTVKPNRLLQRHLDSSIRGRDALHR